MASSEWTDVAATLLLLKEHVASVANAESLNRAAALLERGARMEEALRRMRDWSLVVQAGNAVAIEWDAIVADIDAALAPKGDQP